MTAAKTPRLGVRTTRQRASVMALLADAAEFRSAQDIHNRLRDRSENISLTTVYRTLQALAAEGLLDTLRTDTGESLYRQCSDHHHHHLVCRSCGVTVEVQGRAVESWTARVAEKYAFSDVSHTIEIFGRCAQCASRSAPTGAPARHQHCD